MSRGIRRRDHRSIPFSTPPSTTAMVRPIKPSINSRLRDGANEMSHSLAEVSPAAPSGYEAEKPSIQPATIA